LTPNAKFQLVPKTQGQVWTLEVIDHQLLCGHNSGTFLIENHSANLISTITGGLVIKKLHNNPDVLIEGTYTHLCIYRKNNRGKWQFDHLIEGFSTPARQLEQDSEGNIWVNNLSNAIFKLKLSPDIKKVIKIEPFNDGLVTAKYKNLAKIREKIMLTSEIGMLQYNQQTKKFAPSTILQTAKNQYISKVFYLDKQHLFFLEKNGTLHLINTKGNVSEISFKRDLWVDDYENIRRIDSSRIVLCTENGFAMIPNTQNAILTKQIPTSTIIRSITVLDYPEKNKTINESIYELLKCY
jgi:hypothetical protein